MRAALDTTTEKEPSAPATRERVVDALRSVVRTREVGSVNYADIAAEARLPWQTVRRVLGPREQFADWLADSVPTPRDTRERILESAASVFAQHGYNAASLDEVAANAGLTKGAVYWYFASKHALFFALLENRIQKNFSENLGPALATYSAVSDQKAALTQLLLGIVKRLDDDPDWPRLFLEFMSQARDPAVQTHLGEAYSASYALSARLIEAMYTARGQALPADSHLLAQFWTALIDGLVIAWIANPDLELKLLLPRIVDLIWQGLDTSRSP